MEKEATDKAGKDNKEEAEYEEDGTVDETEAKDEEDEKMEGTEEEIALSPVIIIIPPL